MKIQNENYLTKWQEAGCFVMANNPNSKFDISKLIDANQYPYIPLLGYQNIDNTYYIVSPVHPSRLNLEINNDDTFNENYGIDEYPYPLSLYLQKYNQVIASASHFINDLSSVEVIADKIQSIPQLLIEGEEAINVVIINPGSVLIAKKLMMLFPFDIFGGQPKSIFSLSIIEESPEVLKNLRTFLSTLENGLLAESNFFSSINKFIETNKKADLIILFPTIYPGTGGKVILKNLENNIQSAFNKILKEDGVLTTVYYQELFEPFILPAFPAECIRRISYWNKSDETCPSDCIYDLETIMLEIPEKDWNNHWRFIMPQYSNLEVIMALMNTIAKFNGETEQLHQLSFVTFKKDTKERKPWNKPWNIVSSPDKEKQSIIVSDFTFNDFLETGYNTLDGYRYFGENPTKAILEPVKMSYPFEEVYQYILKNFAEYILEYIEGNPIFYIPYNFHGINSTYSPFVQLVEELRFSQAIQVIAGETPYYIDAELQLAWFNKLIKDTLMIVYSIIVEQIMANTSNDIYTKYESLSFDLDNICGLAKDILVTVEPRLLMWEESINGWAKSDLFSTEKGLLIKELFPDPNKINSTLMFSMQNFFDIVQEKFHQENLASLELGILQVLMEINNIEEDIPF